MRPCHLSSGLVFPSSVVLNLCNFFPEFFTIFQVSDIRVLGFWPLSSFGFCCVFSLWCEGQCVRANGVRANPRSTWLNYNHSWDWWDTILGVSARLAPEDEVRRGGPTLKIDSQNPGTIKKENECQIVLAFPHPHFLTTMLLPALLCHPLRKRMGEPSEPWPE